SSRRRHTRCLSDWSSDVCSSDLVDRAESESELCFRVNAGAVGELGQIAAQAGVRVVHFSTDYVFDGQSTEPYTEESPTHPINTRSEERRVGKECRYRWWRDQ